jgi:hypothetical protein
MKKMKQIFKHEKRKKEDYPLRVIPEPQPQLQPKCKLDPKKKEKTGSGDLMKLKFILIVMTIQSFSLDIKLIYKTI